MAILQGICRTLQWTHRKFLQHLIRLSARRQTFSFFSKTFIELLSRRVPRFTSRHQPAVKAIAKPQEKRLWRTFSKHLKNDPPFPYSHRSKKYVYQTGTSSTQNIISMHRAGNLGRNISSKTG